MHAISASAPRAPTPAHTLMTTGFRPSGLEPIFVRGLGSKLASALMPHWIRPDDRLNIVMSTLSQVFKMIPPPAIVWFSKSKSLHAFQ